MNKPLFTAYFAEIGWKGADSALDAVTRRAQFWQRLGSTAMNERQVKLVTRLLEGFEGKLTTRKWAAIARCSADTALRDIADLLDKGVLVKSPAGGRSTSYELRVTT